MVTDNETSKVYEPPWWVLTLCVAFVVTILGGGWLWFEIHMHNISRPVIWNERDSIANSNHDPININSKHQPLISDEMKLSKNKYVIKGLYSDEDSNRLFVDDNPIPLEPSLKVWNKSPTGFNWGYGGSGPAQSALAICLHLFKSKEIALAVFQDFKFKFVANWPQEQSFEETIDLTEFLREHSDKIKAAQNMD
ncbi:DUF6166 domain-containing protein [Chitinophaga sp. CC14]|uniref:DUF6166 domain-containing protein n=1 Tax=Chitinophaga sp. CC14 TaxID=3029199 RepID=UPI003B814F14